MYITPKIIEAKILEGYNIYLRYETGEDVAPEVLYRGSISLNDYNKKREKK